MKSNVLAITFLLSLGLPLAIGGQPDPRFDGVWVGTETYTTYSTAYQSAMTPIRMAATITINDSGKVVNIDQGLSRGRRFESSPKSDKNKLLIKSDLYKGGRVDGKFVLSADGNELTETGLGFLPGQTHGISCSITGTFHRKAKK